MTTKTATKLQDTIPAGHVMLLYWVRTANDARHCASDTGCRIIKSKGCIAAAEKLDTYGERDDDEHIPAGHGVTILWPSGRTREVRA